MVCVQDRLEEGETAFENSADGEKESSSQSESSERGSLRFDDSEQESLRFEGRLGEERIAVRSMESKNPSDFSSTHGVEVDVYGTPFAHNCGNQGAFPGKELTIRYHIKSAFAIAWIRVCNKARETRWQNVGLGLASLIPAIGLIMIATLKGGTSYETINFMSSLFAGFAGLLAIGLIERHRRTRARRLIDQGVSLSIDVVAGDLLTTLRNISKVQPPFSLLLTACVVVLIPVVMEVAVDYGIRPSIDTVVMSACAAGTMVENSTGTAREVLPSPVSNRNLILNSGGRCSFSTNIVHLRTDSISSTGYTELQLGLCSNRVLGTSMETGVCTMTSFQDWSPNGTIGEDCGRAGWTSDLSDPLKAPNLLYGWRFGDEVPLLTFLVARPIFRISTIFVGDTNVSFQTCGSDTCGAPGGKPVEIRSVGRQRCACGSTSGNCVGTPYETCVRGLVPPYNESDLPRADEVWASAEDGAELSVGLRDRMFVLSRTWPTGEFDDVYLEFGDFGDLTLCEIYNALRGWSFYNIAGGGYDGIISNEALDQLAAHIEYYSTVGTKDVIFKTDYIVATIDWPVWVVVFVSVTVAFVLGCTWSEEEPLPATGEHWYAMGSRDAQVQDGKCAVFGASKPQIIGISSMGNCQHLGGLEAMDAVPRDTSQALHGLTNTTKRTQQHDKTC